MCRMFHRCRLPGPALLHPFAAGLAFEEEKRDAKAMRDICLGILFVLLSGLVMLITSHADERSSPIRPFAGNPRYWEYKGKPTFLRGGSREDNLFQIPDLREHLDLLAGVGGNYIRNTLSSRDQGDVWPFLQREDGLYDLHRPNDEYFKRLKNLLDLALERDIIVQFEMWDRFDFAREPWLDNPYRPSNNVNYTARQSGLAEEYPRHPGNNDNPFFRSIPEHDNNELLLQYQKAQVDWVLALALQYPNVLYCMDNETNATAEWGAFWARQIREKAARAGVEVHMTEMWDAWDLKDEQHRRTLDHPELYSFADISQNNHNKGQQHWDNLQWVREYVRVRPRPLNHVKIYGADTGRYGNDRDAIERFWRSLIGGAASIRFHRPPAGIGLNEKAQACLRSAGLLLSDFDILMAQPDFSSRLLKNRQNNEAYLAFIQGEQYALYFPDGGSVDLDLRRIPGNLQLRWLNIMESRWLRGPSMRGGRFVRLNSPGKGHWLALLSRTEG
jgi:hypothetical protein